MEFDAIFAASDDIASAAWYSPALTTVSQSISEGGEALVASLFARINGEATSEAASSVVLPPKLVIRQSCGAQPA